WACTWGDDSGAGLWEPGGHDTLPLGPHPGYAAAECAADQPADGPIFYRLEHILEVTYPQVLSHRLHVGIFPVDSVFAVLLSPREFGEMLDGISCGAIIFTR
ncbi:MAG TPA: hypothetical protein VFT95_10160, partial [Micromonosporaceae bacterium]|nr:hypothetical protein [Micromonosporaceae bacterium]